MQRFHIRNEQNARTLPVTGSPRAAYQQIRCEQGMKVVMASSPVGEHVRLVGVEQAVLAVAPRERFAADPEVGERLELLCVRVLGDEEGL